jgi:hypothetical protein
MRNALPRGLLLCLNRLVHITRRAPFGEAQLRLFRLG